MVSRIRLRAFRCSHTRRPTRTSQTNQTGSLSLSRSVSAGSVFRLPLARAKLSEVVGGMKDQGLRLVGTASHKGTLLDQAKLSGPLAIFIGSEGAGLSRDLIQQMDEVLAIPQAVQVESRKVGVAASIVFY